MTLQLKDLRYETVLLFPAEGWLLICRNRWQTNIRNAETQISEPFKGLTTGGQVVPGLFTLRKTGLSNEGMKRAAEA